MKFLAHFALALAVMVPLGLPTVALAELARTIPGVGALSLNEQSGALTLLIPHQGRNPYRILWLNGPRRLVVDIEGLALLGKRSVLVGGLVHRIRAARFGRNVTRVVFDLNRAADLSTLTDAARGTLALVVHPKGAPPNLAGHSLSAAPVPAQPPSPPPTPAPAVQPTPPLLPVEPEARITPEPVPFRPAPVPSFLPTPAMPTPPPFPVMEAPSPVPTAPPSVEPAAPQIFGSRLSLGASAPLNLSETYPAGVSSISVPGPLLGGTLSLDQMIGSYFGFSLGGRAMSYTIDDAATSPALSTPISHKRDDYEGFFGLRLRLPLPFGFELMAQPGGMVRWVSVDSQDGQGSVTLAQYLYSGYYAYGPNVSGALGWHVWGPLSLVAEAEYDYLLAGVMLTRGVSPIFPLTGLRFGGEARLEFAAFGLSAGYNQTSYVHAGQDPGLTDTLNQSWGGPYVKLNLIY